MQAIITKYVPATNYKPSRIRAKCERGSLMASWDDGLDVEQNHKAAVAQLVSRFVREDVAKYGATQEQNPWLRPMACGQIPDGRFVFCFIPKSK